MRRAAPIGLGGLAVLVILSLVTGQNFLSEVDPTGGGVPIDQPATPTGPRSAAEDEMGRFVWESIDGKTSVQQVIRRLSKRYNINVREAQVATTQFLNMLTRKGLIGMQIKDAGGGGGKKAN